jgi:hemolysin activation/secretion protein
MQNLNLRLLKALLGACLLAVQGFASAKAISLSESQTNTHCLFIEQLELADLEGRKLPEFDWLRETLVAPQPDAIDRACLSAKDVDALLSRAQQVLIEKGFLTTRVLFQASAKKNDQLVFALVPGRIRTNRFDNPDNATTDLRWAFPAQAGDLLNVRDIEQALENLKRMACFSYRLKQAVWKSFLNS